MPAHLIASLMSLLFHREALLLIEDNSVQGLSDLLDRRLARIYEHSTGVPTDDESSRATSVGVYQFKGISGLCGHGHSSGTNSSHPNCAYLACEVFQRAGKITCKRSNTTSSRWIRANNTNVVSHLLNRFKLY